MAFLLSPRGTCGEYNNEGVLWFEDCFKVRNGLEKPLFTPIKIGKNIDNIVDFKDEKAFWVDLGKEMSLVFLMIPK